jgi:cytochrome c-type biogenesis protein CcmH/NrfG
MSPAAYEPVATTEETSSSSPARSRSRFVAVVLVLLLSVFALASFYKLGIWNVPATPLASRPPTTPPQSENKTETQIVMPHGKYSVG